MQNVRYSMCVCSKKNVPLSECVSKQCMECVILSLLPLFMGQKQYPANDFWLSKSTKLKEHRDSRSTHYMRAILFYDRVTRNSPSAASRTRFSLYILLPTKIGSFFLLSNVTLETWKIYTYKIVPLDKIISPSKAFFTHVHRVKCYLVYQRGCYSMPTSLR